MSKIICRGCKERTDSYDTIGGCCMLCAEKRLQQQDKLLEACKMGLKLAQMLNHPDEHHIEHAIAEAENNPVSLAGQS